MDTPPQNESPVKRRRAGCYCLAAFAALFLVMLAVYTLSVSKTTKVTWLTPAEALRSWHPNSLSQLKYKFLRLSGPVGRWLMRHRRTIQITTHIVTISPAAAGQFDFGAPLSTNADGMRAWVLQSAEMKAFGQNVKTNAGVNTLSVPTVITVNGGPAQVSVVNAFKPSLASTNTVEAGTIVHLTPRIFSDSVNLLVFATSTEFVAWTSNEVPLLKTNLAVACGATIPHNGALLLDAGTNAAATHYWLFITPTLLDFQGRPIQP